MFTCSCKPSILIVDDDLSILRTLTRIFERQGFKVVTAERGMEAVKALSASHFDLALIDFCLPDMEGTEVLQFAQNASIKVMLTGKQIPLPPGVDLMLNKPIAPQALLSLIDTKLKDANIEH